VTRTIRIDHLARVEGHGGITVELDRDTVHRVEFNVFEGLRLLEGLVRGRSYEDVPQVVSRICAICSMAHAITCIKATEQAFGVVPSRQTELLRDLAFRGENIESHALHLFLLALPDYLGYPSATVMASTRRDAVQLGLRLKRLGNAIQELIGGRAIHPVNCLIGGFGKPPSIADLARLRGDLEQGMVDCQTAIDIWATLDAVDFIQDDIAFAALRSSAEYGYYSGAAISVLADGQLTAVPAADYRSLTNERTVPHSHAKHSRYVDRSFMVGALARLAINGGKLGGKAKTALAELDLMTPSTNPLDNNKAQAVELLFDVEYALDVVDRLLETSPSQEDPVPVAVREGAGVAVTEAPRGLLCYQLGFDGDGRITSADVITPTAMNAASVEDSLAQAVAQSPDKTTAILTQKLEMVARAYDPCISCSVHLVRRRGAG
jgi:sulfhydrogenase subunit alpha